MPAARFAEDFKEWVEAYENAGNIVQKENRIYKLNDDIILIMFSIRKHLTNNNLIITTDNDNRTQLKKAATIAKKENLKFFCCAIYDKNETVKYPVMQDYILSIESFDYLLKPGHTTIALTSYYDDLVVNTKDVYRFSHNGTNMAFVRKNKFEKYLEYFDNRSYLSEGVYKADKIEYRDGAWLKDKEFIEIQYPNNLLIHGAPGTGKSSMISKFFDDNEIDESHYQRVTFYEDYSYGSFVGTYKPVMEDVSKELLVDGLTDKYSGVVLGKQVVYEFVPGPFSQILLKAYLQIIEKDEEIDNFYLIIEEINRAKAASVFGDMFQLLDRKNGTSVYEVTPSAEFLKWFNESISIETGQESNLKSIKLPPNMYIWATMNSADQGVFPLDTAFKRRWGYIYKDINVKSSKIINLISITEASICGADYDWDNFRRGINGYICKYYDEDKCIGPGYFSDEEFEYIKEYTEAVVNGNDTSELNNPLVDKLLSYLRQDVFRNNPKAFFEEEYISMTDIRLAIKVGKKLTDITKLTDNDFVSVTVSVT